MARSNGSTISLMNDFVHVVIRMVPSYSRNVPALIARAVPTLMLASLFASCASSHHPQQVSENRRPGFARSLKLGAKASAGTLHFPAGLYLLDAADDTGFYYRAPRKVIKHSFSGFVPYDGGIFVQKDDQRKIRGYIIWAAGRTKVGDLSKTPHEFRD
jgi:hypothetical protein